MFPWLTTLMLTPALGAVVLMLLPDGFRRTREVALGFATLTLGIGIAAALQFDLGAAGSLQLREVHEWIPQFGVSYALGVDGLALAMILLGVILVPICLIAAWDDVPKPGRRQQGYFAWMLLLAAFMIGVFAAIDVFLFYVFFEAMLIPVYFLIGGYGGPDRARAATKFLLYSLFGGLIMLVGVIVVYQLGPGGTDGFLIENLTGLGIGGSTEIFLFFAFFIAFAIKAPMWPVHTWLPHAASEGRPATSVLLVGVLDKVGTFGMIRFCLQMFPEASQWATPLVLTLAVVSIVFGAMLAIGQTDMLRLIAYTSISHFGFIIMGIFAFNAVSGTGATLYMVNHGFTTAALFLVAGMFIARNGSRQISAYGGWQRVTPLLAGSLLIAGLSGLALPGLNSFVSEFMVIVGTFTTEPVFAVIGASGVVLAALYILLWYKKVATGPKPLEAAETTRDMTLREKVVVAPLIAVFLFLGFYPKPVIDLLEPSVDTTLEVVTTDAVPSTTEGSDG